MNHYSILIFLLIAFSPIIKANSVPPLHHASGISSTQDLQKVAYDLDVAMADIFRRHDFELPQSVDDSIFLRRVFLVLCGRIPTLAETEAYLNWADDNKQDLLVQQLLRSEEYENHKLNWYRDLFRVKTEPGRLNIYLMRHFDDWLKSEVRAGTSWKDLSYKMLSARGKIDGNPEVGYYLGNGGDLNTNVGYLFEAFLATNITCAECHDHPHENFTRKDFFQVAAFLNGVVGNLQIKKGLDYAKKELLLEAFNGNGKKVKGYLNLHGGKLNGVAAIINSHTFEGIGKGGIPLPSDYQYSDRKPREIVNAKTPDFGVKISTDYSDNPGKDEDSLELLAAWVTDESNKKFAANLANRIWKRVMGTSLYFNQDLYQESSELPYAELVEALIKAVRDLNYDSRALEHALVMTQTFKFESYKDYAFDGSFEMLQGRQLRRMSAEQFWDSLVVLKDSSENLMIPKEYQPIKYIDRWPISGREVDKKTMKKLLVDHSNNTKTIEDFDGFLKNFTETFNSFPQVEVDQSQFRPSAQLVSPAGVDHILNLFGQSQRKEINNSNTYSNLSQALELMNGVIQKEIVYNDKSSINQFINQGKTPEEKINKMYLAIYSREPKLWEKKMCLDLVAEEKDKAYNIILSSLISSSEFLFIQ